MFTRTKVPASHHNDKLSKANEPATDSSQYLLTMPLVPISYYTIARLSHRLNKMETVS